MPCGNTGPGHELHFCTNCEFFKRPMKKCWNCIGGKCGFKSVQTQSKEEVYRAALEKIVWAGKWMGELEKSQDLAFIHMPLAYSKDCFRTAKKALKDG
jgi:hypothetical protein